MKVYTVEVILGGIPEIEVFAHEDRALNAVVDAILDAGTELEYWYQATFQANYLDIEVTNIDADPRIAARQLANDFSYLSDGNNWEVRVEEQEVNEAIA